MKPFAELHPIHLTEDGKKKAEPIPPLTIYKASAGSGKTFTLAVEYIKLLISNPTNYRYILAVTFTNKATQEMKQRILSKLYGIARHLTDADLYFEKVSEAFPQASEDEIRLRAQMALNLLVHDYSHFRVETIDSFFQRVLRNLAHELGLTANLQVMLNDEEVKNQAVDNIIANVESDHDQLLNWIMHYVSQNIEEDKNWNVIDNIKKFGSNLSKDFYKDNAKQLVAIMTDEAFFERYTATLEKKRDEAKVLMKSFAKRYYQIAEQNGLNSSCYTYGDKNVPGYMKRLNDGSFGSKDDKGKPTFPNSYIKNGLADPKKFLKSADLNKPFAQVIISQVAPLVEKAERERPGAEIVVNSVNAILSNINQLRLLGRIEQEVRRINNDNNDFPLSSTPRLLNKLIDKQDSPFIYEKIGGQLRFIMIDEFQDTSNIQWDNFKVLLDDCIAHQAGSLIVGDVKQSIYRWRDGDWRLLHSLNEQNHPNEIWEKTLKDNYRSERNVVEFNNAFFSQAAEYLSRKFETKGFTEDLKSEARTIKSAYDDIRQNVPKDKKNNGLVWFALMEKGDMMQQVENVLVKLLESGVEQKKIAIIVRSNDQIEEIANHFLHCPVSVGGEERMLNLVSDEAFRLDASPSVNVIVKAMHSLTHPDDQLDKVFLAKAYQKSDHFDDMILNEKDYSQLLPEGMTQKRATLLAKPLMDLAEKLYEIFHLDQFDDAAYVCAFFDQLAAFLNKKVASIDDFLAEWDKTICSKSIQSAEIDGIRLLTIHKSKGLEFDNLIIPFCQWTAEKPGTIFWAKPDTEPYSQLPVAPLPWKNELKYSIFREQHLSERIKIAVDNLNIMYVAFTRASKNLFVMSKGKSSFPKELFDNILKKDDFTVNGEKLAVNTDEESGDNFYSYGSLYIPGKKPEKTSANIFDQKEKGVTVKIEPNDKKDSFVQSNASKEFMLSGEELEEHNRIRQYIDTGLVIHSLLASMRDYTDLDKAIGKLEYDGVLYNETFNKEQLRGYMSTILSTPEVRDWFSPSWQVFNECSILSKNEKKNTVEEHRPDRVIYNQREMKVIDFKTGMPLPKHHNQVREYVRLLRDMGYDNVSGYLWYIRDNNIIKVEA